MDDDIARAQRGEMEAFERLYRSQVGRVNALCLRLTGGQGAEELLQDVFVRVWEKLPSFRGESAFNTWVHRLAVNVFLLSRRGDLRREARVVGAEDPEALGIDQARGFVDDDPDARMDLERAIARLPAGARGIRTARCRGIQARGDRRDAGRRRRHSACTAAPGPQAAH